MSSLKPGELRQDADSTGVHSQVYVFWSPPAPVAERALNNPTPMKEAAPVTNAWNIVLRYQ